jgi:Mg-chelatase subunit ChlD
MRWTGLTPLQLTVALAAFGAAVVALYLLKQRPRRVDVPAVALWESMLGKRDAAALWTRLRRLWSLLLALLVVGLVLFAIADLRKQAARESRALIVLIDASASMAASDEKPSRLARAKERARKLVDTLGPGERAMIVQLDAQATALSPLSDDAVALRRAIDDVQQTDLAGDLEPAAELAVDVLAKEKRAELVLLSDGNLQHIAEAEAHLKNARISKRYLSVGREQRNFAITSFSVRRYPLDKTHHESIVTITSFAPTDERVRLTVRARDALLYDETLKLPHGQSVTRSLTDLAGADDALEAEITPERGRDVLASDDRAFATLPPRRRTRVLTVSEGNRYLEAALLLDEYLDVDERTPKTYRGAEGHDVVIFDRFVPEVMPDAAALFVGPGESSSSVLRVTGQVERPFFEQIEREHPLVRLCKLSDVNAARAARIALESEDHVVAASRERVPLIVEGKRSGHPFVALAIDVRVSDLPLRTAWPLFLLSAIDRLSGDTEASLSGSEAGDVVRVMLPNGVKSAEIVSQQGVREQAHALAGSVRIVRERAGLYTVHAGAVSEKLAVNVPSALEGKLAPEPYVLSQAEKQVPQAAPSLFLGERLWPFLLTLALLLLAVEWLTFHRRWTL